MATNNLRALPRISETDREKAIRRMADLVHQMNQAVGRVVDFGITVELVRCSRYHNERGQWGDQMIPMVRVTESAEEKPAHDPA